MKVLEYYSLKKINTFGIDVQARYFVEVDSCPSIQNILSDKLFLNKKDRFLVLGGGSNILFTKNYDGLIVKNNIKGIELQNQDAAHYYVKVGAGEKWHDFVMYCVERNYAGVENLSLIPGSVGAAPIQNIGAYGVEQKSVFHELSAIDINDNKTITLTNQQCRFGYRDSIFKNEVKGKYIITHVIFKLFKKPIFNTTYGAIDQELNRMGIRELSISAISKAVCNIRSSKLPDPDQLGNAGSFFKNPVVSNDQYESIKKNFPNISAYKDAVGMKLAAGWLIEQCGWKGKRIGNTGSHKDQALVLVNYGNASGEEVYALSEEILQSVKEKFGVQLEREVVIL